MAAPTKYLQIVLSRLSLRCRSMTIAVRRCVHKDILTPTSDNSELSSSMPLQLSNRSVANFVNYYEHDQKYEEFFAQLETLLTNFWHLIKLISGFNLLRTLLITLIHFNKDGIRKSERLLMPWGSFYAPILRPSPRAQATVKSTLIAMNANERTPLLKKGQSYGGTSLAAAAAMSDGYISASAADSSYGSDNDNSSVQEDYAGHENAGMGKYRRDCCSYLQIMTFVLILAGGCVIATYLLIAESRIPAMQFSLDLVHRDIWSNVSAPLADFLNCSNVINIVIMQTGGSGCEKLDKCLKILRELQKQYQKQLGMAQEVPFNFLIGGDRQTYEARGWNYESGLNWVAQNATLVIAFIGNYTTLAPNALQLRSTLSLIAESVRQKKLQSQYKIYGLQNLTNSEVDGKALFDAISQWTQFKGLIQVL